MAVMHDTLLKCVCTVSSVYHHNVYVLSESFQGTVHLKEQNTKEQKDLGMNYMLLEPYIVF